jgi:Rrf2 family cysteine metabolism transcriptional repressor
MIFTTKAEYGVRLLVELGRQHDGAGATDGPIPVSLKAIAEAENLPLAYLERIVALLKKAGLVEATRGAHGGYRLAKPASEITMDAVVEALEGQIAPMECFHDAPDGKVLCSHEDDGDYACATKLLWTRVQGGVTKALSGTTLAELVEFGGSEPRAERSAPVGTAA